MYSKCHFRIDGRHIAVFLEKITVAQLSKKQTPRLVQNAKGRARVNKNPALKPAFAS
jgi:hypothetical protein